MFQLNWGAPASSGLGDIDVPADYDGDGITDVAIYRQATAEWFIRKSFDSSLQQVSFGAPASLGLGDTPIPSDYDGDGLADWYDPNRTTVNGPATLQGQTLPKCPIP